MLGPLRTVLCSSLSFLLVFSQNSLVLGITSYDSVLTDCRFRFPTRLLLLALVGVIFVFQFLSRLAESM